MSKHLYNYFPKTKEELRNLIKQRIKEEGIEVDLNDIDVSEIIDMSRLFENLNFNGDISNWDVSKVIYMTCMFYECKKFNGDISKWDVSNVKCKLSMFNNCPIKEKYKPKFKI